MEMTVIIQGDSEGYVTFECPFCGSEFKLQTIMALQMLREQEL